MTDERSLEAIPGTSTPLPRRRSPWFVFFALALLLVAVIAGGIAASPYWAPQIEPLLPWTRTNAVSPTASNRLAARVGALEAHIRADADAAARARRETSAAIEAINGNLKDLDKRIAALPQTSPASVSGAAGDIGRLDRQIAALQKTVVALAKPHPAAPAAPTQNSGEGAAAVAKIETRLAALEARSASRTQQLRVEIGQLAAKETRLAAVTAGLADRVPALAAKLHAQKNAGEADAALFLGLLQIRESVEEGRPFPQEYNAFLTLMRDWPDIQDAARPLAAAARSGVPSRLAIMHEFDAVAPKIAAVKPPKAPPKKPGWGARIAAEVRSLVKIREIGQDAAPGPARAVGIARRALEQNDLKAAIDAIRPLTGAAAEAARPWLEVAQRRLAAETSLADLQALMVHRLIGRPPMPGGPAGAAHGGGANAPKRPGSRS